MKLQLTTTILNELIEVSLDNFIYYIPSEIIFDDVLDQLEGEIEDDFFDELSFLSIEKGIALIKNEDALEINELLIEKRFLLEKNVSSLIEKSKELTSIEFQILVKEYYNQLLFFLYITEWLNKNIKKYNKQAIHISIIGAFNLQHHYLNSHLKDIFIHFGSIVNFEREHHFSTEELVMECFPDLITRYSHIENERTAHKENEEETVLKDKLPKPIKKIIKKKKQRPILSDEKIEKMILESVFKMKVN